MSIYLRYSSIPVTLSRPYETASSRDELGNLKIINFPNQWGDSLISFASSGFMTLAASSGIVLNTPGYVDVSGLRSNSIFSQNYYRIDSDGDVIDFFPGNTGSLTYKVSSSEIGTVDNFIYDTGINKLTNTDGSPGSPLYVHPGSNLDGSDPTREITTFDPISFRPQIVIPSEEAGQPPTVYPPRVVISGTDLIVEKIQIGEALEDYRGAILTHQGADGSALWLQNEYLEADGMAWYRYPKRAVRLEPGRIIFYANLPSWAILTDPADYLGFNLETLLEEFEVNDTIGIYRKLDSGLFETTPKFVKPIVDLLFLPDALQDVKRDPETDPGPYIQQITFTEDGETKTGFAMLACGEANALPDTDGEYAHGYVFSVTRGAYLSMEMGKDATASFTCADSPNEAGFKPSTSNNISIRPNIHTSFNALAENIDFVVYGKYPTLYNKYDESVFAKDDTLLPIGLVAGFKLDANVPDAIQGHPSSGAFFNQYIDRLKTIPAGFSLDFSPKISINTNDPHVIDSIASGVGFLNYYASLSVSGATYSDQLIAQDIYLLPKPDQDGTGKYIQNALLTIDSNGKIISRIPVENPTIPSPPTNVNILIAGNNECSLSWTPSDDGGRDIIKYILEFSANAGNTWTSIPEDQISRGLDNQTSCTVTDLQTSVRYLFRVIAQNSVGYSNPSEPSSEFISNYDVSQTPQNVNSYRTFGDELSIIELSWNAPDSYGTSEISGYIIEESDNNGSNWIYHNTAESLITATSEVIYGLMNGTNYLYRISAINASGQGCYNFTYVSGNIPPIIENLDEAQAAEETLANWDFGVVLFTGVCQS